MCHRSTLDAASRVVSQPCALVHGTSVERRVLILYMLLSSGLSEQGPDPPLPPFGTWCQIRNFQRLCAALLLVLALAAEPDYAAVGARLPRRAAGHGVLRL